MKQNLRRVATNKRKALSRVPVTLRLPEDVVRRIDEELDGRDVPLSRNNWFLEAVIEKLRRNGSGEQHGA
jgi:hypothetical protein